MKKTSLNTLIILLITVALNSISIAEDVSFSKDIYLIADSDANALINQKPEYISKAILKKAAAQQNLLPITIDYPFDKSIFPPEIVAPSFLWHDPQESSKLWLIDVSFKDSSNHIYAITSGKLRERRIDANAVSPTNSG